MQTATRAREWGEQACGPPVGSFPARCPLWIWPHRAKTNPQDGKGALEKAKKYAGGGQSRGNGAFKHSMKLFPGHRRLQKPRHGVAREGESAPRGKGAFLGWRGPTLESLAEFGSLTGDRGQEKPQKNLIGGPYVDLLKGGFRIW
ncbi:unnamed protein product [Arctia plantaginis]|uniref:Uncharacterized protein n=1 Tax=Arctia plantaginis TaxID=874455 RepID=A0A8S1B9Y7_ARCPL|nr:unnamed protein product [Arctia plantaginis]